VKLLLLDFIFRSPTSSERGGVRWDRATRLVVCFRYYAVTVSWRVGSEVRTDGEFASGNPTVHICFLDHAFGYIQWRAKRMHAGVSRVLPGLFCSIKIPVRDT